MLGHAVLLKAPPCYLRPCSSFAKRQPVGIVNKLLVAEKRISGALAPAGRRPYYTGLGLDSVGVELDKRGRIKASSLPLSIHPLLCVCTSPGIAWYSTGSAQACMGMLPRVFVG